MKISKARLDLKKYDNPLNWIGFLPLEEDRILRMINIAEYLIESDFKLGYSHICEADKLYKKEFGGYKKEIDIKFSRVFNMYLDSPLSFSNFQ